MVRAASYSPEFSFSKSPVEDESAVEIIILPLDEHGQVSRAQRPYWVWMDREGDCASLVRATSGGALSLKNSLSTSLLGPMWVVGGFRDTLVTPSLFVLPEVARPDDGPDANIRPIVVKITDPECGQVFLCVADLNGSYGAIEILPDDYGEEPPPPPPMGGGDGP